MGIARRVAERVNRDYPLSQRAQVIALLDSLDLGPRAPTGIDEGEERIHAAILNIAAGNLDRLLEAAVLAEVDWRDLIVGGGLEHDDWRVRVTESLGPPI